MATMTGRRGLMEMLRAEGIEYIFGNPGTSETPIMEELERHPDLKYVLVTQEGVGMGMADALARATGKPSFVNLHIETGLANAISLLHNSKEGGTPLVLSSANKDIRELAHGRTDLAEMVRLFTKFTAEATHPEQVPSLVRRAFNEAKTPPTGPTFVGFSANALDGVADMEISPSGTGYFRTGPDGRAIEDAVRILGGSEDPILLVGDRVAQSEAVYEAVRVAELLGARVYASAYSEVNFPMTHPQFAGAVRLGFKDTKEMLSKADAVLAVGRMSTYAHLFSDAEQLLIGLDTKLIHIDTDPSEVGKIQPTDVGIIADPKVALTELADALETGLSGSVKEAAKGRAVTVAAEKEAARASWQRTVKEKWDRRPMSDERMVSEIAAALPDDAVILGDANTSRAAIGGVFEFDRPGSFYNMRGGAIGWGMGGTMGLKLAHPDRPVVGFVGDGSAMMTVQGFWTAATQNIPVVYVITNNGAYKVLKGGMDAYKKTILKEETPSKYIGMDFPSHLNMAALAEDMGVHGRRIEDPAELGPAMQEALDSGKPAVLDVIIDGSV